ncbi:MAG: ATP-binding protein [Elusimicrobiota bacterium]|nr:MAG: ATP-binding protein [Elusimicrobiota bacterium]
MNDQRLESTAEAIIDTVREPLVLLDSGLRVVRVNGAFRRVFKTAPEEAVGRELAALGDGQWDDAGLLAALRKVLADEAPFEDLVVERVYPRLGRRAMALNARPLRQPEGRAPLILLAIEDETERREAAELLRRQSEELARSNRDLEEFAYAASHDLQEPLRMVVSYTQLLAKRYQGKLGPEADEFIGFAVDGAKRMQRLISDLLAYSRLDRSAGPAPAASAGEALSDALRALAAALEEAGGTVEAGPLPAVAVDYSQLVQLFQNLVGNALKFRSARPPVVKVSAAREGALWRFRVEDNGIGIDPRYFDKVFIIFERLHGVDVPGSGIGLALCRKIVHRHGGRIWIEAGASGGAVFQFTVPQGASQ